MIIILTILLSLIFTPAYSGAYIGTAVNYLKLDDYQYKYSNDPSASFTIGYYHNFKPIVLTASTNRLFNPETNTGFSDKKTGTMYQSESKTKIDTFMVGYNVKRLTPSLMVSNVELDKSVYYNSKEVAKSSQTSLIYGANLSYVYDKRFTFSATVIAPNEEFSLKYGLQFGINYSL